ncbi:MAG: metal-sensitive transcriptional regulator [Planctomycetota bacterium]|nr:MAG: metal-sensitive transcriptional regulator [Planctomycetota bacterium]
MSLCGTREEHERIINRINRIEGQIRGIKKLVEQDKECFDVLKQVAAAGGAIKGLATILLENHLKGCVAEAIDNKDHNSSLLNETLKLFRKFAS